MKAAEITDATIAEMGSGAFRHGRINFANGDMVGHTGLLEPSILAVEAIDLCIGRLIRLIDKTHGALVVTADHGNCDEMVEHDKKTGAIARKKDGTPMVKTSHTLNPVPFYVWAPGAKGLAIDTGVKTPGLANVAATVLTLLGYGRPEGYEPSLVKVG